jgi:hypothetical protein
MSGAEWAVLVPAIVGVLGAGRAWLKASAASRTAQMAATSAEAAHTRIDGLATGPSVKAQP